MDVLSASYKKEQREYFLSTSQWTDIHPQQLLGPSACFKRYDLHTLTLEELKVRVQGDSQRGVERCATGLAREEREMRDGESQRGMGRT